MPGQPGFPSTRRFTSTWSPGPAVPSFDPSFPYEKNAISLGIRAIFPCGSVAQNPCLGRERQIAPRGGTNDAGERPSMGRVLRRISEPKHS